MQDPNKLTLRKAENSFLGIIMGRINYIKIYFVFYQHDLSCIK